MASDLRVLLIRDCLRDLGVSDFRRSGTPSRPSPQVKRYLPAAADGSPTVSRTLPPGCPTLLRDGDLGPWPAARTGKNDVGWEETGTGPGLRPDVARQREDGRGRPRSRRVGRIGARACAPHCEASSLGGKDRRRPARRPAGRLWRRVQRRRADRRAGQLPGAPADPAAVRQRVLRQPGRLAWRERPPGRHGLPVTCHNNPGQGNPEPDESLTLPDTPLYGTVRVDAWRQVHPLIHGDRGWFSGWDGELPRLAWYRAPRHRGPPARWPQAPEGDVAVARRARTPGQTDRWVRLVMAAAAQLLLLARPLAADLRRPWERRPGPDRPLPAGRVRRGFPNIWPCLGIPARVAKPTRAGPRAPSAARHPATRWLKNRQPGRNGHATRRVRG